MKILVTGASGFIGKYVINEILHNSSFDIIASSRNISNLKLLYNDSRVQFIEHNIFGKYENENLYEKFFKPDMLIHLAWSNLPNYMMPFHLTENLPADIKFITNLIDNGLKNLTITGTCFEYGLKEGCLDENMECNPINYYALAKDSLRKFIEIYSEEHEVYFKWTRLFYMYGEGQNPNSLFSQLDRAIEEKKAYFNMTGGQQVRDYLHVKEVAQNIVKIALQNDVTGTINICSGNPQKLINVIEEYLNQNKIKIGLNLGFYPYSPLEPMAFWGNNKKLKQIN